MNYSALLERVSHWTGLASAAAAERALLATVAALGTCLPAEDRALWAKALPPQLHDAWQLASYRPHQTTESVLAQVPAAEGMPQPYATEHAQAVIRVLADALEPEHRELLARHLPAELAAMVLEPRLEEGAGARHAIDLQGTGERDSTLASGRPGSQTPLSEAHGVVPRR